MIAGDFEIEWSYYDNLVTYEQKSALKKIQWSSARQKLFFLLLKDDVIKTFCQTLN